MSHIETNSVDREENADLFIQLKLHAELKRISVSFSFDEAKRKFAIFQSGQRRNIFHYPRRPSTQETNATNILQKQDACESMPSEKVLYEIKLDRELESLIDICNTALQSLKYSEDTDLCNKLNSVIVKQRQYDGEVLQMEEEFKKNKVKHKDLRSKIAIEQQIWEERHKNQDDKIAQLRFNLRNVRHLNDLEYDLVKKWEQNRHEQAKMVSINAEFTLQQQIMNYKQMQHAEDVRFPATLKYLNVQMEEYRISIGQWQKKFVSELARCDAENQAQEQRIFELSKLHERQRLVYEQRVQFVEAYMVQKAEEQQLLMQEMRRIQSAVLIQSWWRGTMVRRGFGPFRKKSKKPKKAKAK